MSLRAILWTITLAIVIGGVCFSLAMIQATDHTTVFAFGDVPHNQGITLEGFQAIKLRMRKLDVDWILFGHEPMLVSEIGQQTTYTWEKDGRLIGVVFESGQVAGKWQRGL